MQAARRFNLSTTTNNSAAFSNFKKVISEISNTIRGSNVQWRRGRSFAASVPSDSSKSQGGRKRVSKDERRVMLGSFVDKYRSLNVGKYPTPSAAQRQVGGSYYVIKMMLQELEYNSRVAATSMGDEGALVKDVQEKVSQSSPKVEVADISEMTVKLTSNSSVKETDESHKGVVNKLDPATNNYYEEKEEPEDLIQVQHQTLEAVDDTKAGDESSSILSSIHPIDSESKEVSHACEDGSKGDAIQETGKEAPDSDKHEREMSRMESKEDPSSTRSTMWGNLKSFADGIINLWRKM